MRLVYNANFPRWEVYGKIPVIRGGKQQPSFVSAEKAKCVAYLRKVSGKLKNTPYRELCSFSGMK